jgi:hypothetical protein
VVQRADALVMPGAYPLGQLHLRIPLTSQVLLHLLQQRLQLAAANAQGYAGGQDVDEIVRCRRHAGARFSLLCRANANSRGQRRFFTQDVAFEQACRDTN